MTVTTGELGVRSEGHERGVRVMTSESMRVNRRWARWGCCGLPFVGAAGGAGGACAVVNRALCALIRHQSRRYYEQHVK